MFASFIKAPRPTLVAASPRSAIAASALPVPDAAVPDALHATSSVGSDWEHVPREVPSTSYEPQHETRHGPTFIVSGAGEAEETLKAAYAEYVRSGREAAALCFESLLKRDQEHGRLSIAQAACALSTKLLALPSLPSVGSGASAGAGSPAASLAFSPGGAAAVAGSAGESASATPLLVSMLIEEKASRHRTLCALLRKTLPAELLRMPLRAPPTEQYAAAGAGLGGRGGAGGGGEEEAAEAAAADEAAAAKRTLADVLVDNEARLASARALRTEHNALTSLAAHPAGVGAAGMLGGGDGGRRDDMEDAGARLALAQLQESLSRCAAESAAARGVPEPAVGGAAGFAFYRDVDQIDRWLPHLADALCATAARCAAPDGSPRAASVAHALLLLLRIGAAVVTAAERAAAEHFGVDQREASARAAGTAGAMGPSGADFASPSWLCATAARRALLRAADGVVSWCLQPSTSAFGGGAHAGAGASEPTARELLPLARTLAAASARVLVGRTAAAWERAGGESGAPAAEAAARSAADFQRAVTALARARREAVRIFAPAHSVGAGVLPGAAARYALAIAVELAEELHEFAMLAELCSRADAPPLSGGGASGLGGAGSGGFGGNGEENRLGYYMRKFHPSPAIHGGGCGALWRWERGPAPATDAGAETAEAAVGGGFVHALMRYYLASGSATLPLLLQLPAAYDDDVALFLQAHPRLLWLHHLKVGARAAAQEGAAAERVKDSVARTAFEPRSPFASLAQPAAGLFAGGALGGAGGAEDGDGGGTADGGASAFGRAAATLYEQAAAETASLSMRLLFAHLGKLSHLASAPSALSGAAGAVPFAAAGELPAQAGANEFALAGRTFGGVPPEPIAVPLPNTAGGRTSWPLERADNCVYSIQAQKLLDGLGPSDDAPVHSATDLIQLALSRGGAGQGGGAMGEGGSPVGAAGPQGGGLSESDLFLVLDLWHASRWEEEDARAEDAAPKVGTDGALLPPRTGEHSQLGLVSRFRADLLCAIWSESISAELLSVWERLCGPSAGWDGDEQVEAVAQSSLLYRAILYQHAHGRLETLPSIERAVTILLGVDNPPVPEHVRPTLQQRVRQVCEVALAHARRGDATAGPAEHAEQGEASGMQL